MIHSTFPFLLIDAHLHFQICSIGCFRLQNECHPHYHAADIILTGGCSFINQQIWNEIIIALAILGKCFKIEMLSVGKWSMYTHISGWNTFHFGQFRSLIVAGWRRWRSWCSGRRWCRSGWRCTRASAPLAWQRILCSTIFARKAAVRKIVRNHCHVSFYCSLYLFCPGNTTPCLFSSRT